MLSASLKNWEVEEKENTCNVWQHYSGLERDMLGCPSDIFALDLGCFLVRGCEGLTSVTCAFAKCSTLEAVSQGLKPRYLSVLKVSYRQ